MKAVTAVESGDSDVLTVTDRDPPTIDKDKNEVQISVDAAGVNFADVEQRRGNYPEGPSPPFVPGLEVAGTVTAAPARLMNVLVSGQPESSVHLTRAVASSQFGHHSGPGASPSVVITSATVAVTQV